ncbi:hypothetical protein [Flavobacterium chungbukense]|uniref:Uncharacterized protein n=1 Tax=Flavobacterium chungbukense TaxID=877464 RepID=A0ABP7YBK1_9FLAO|nr:hypothetical protein [Flavobacterium chungbukense]MCC4922455.1 hypothetical protein [Flavobacterium chungbukense]
MEEQNLTAFLAIVFYNYSYMTGKLNVQKLKETLNYLEAKQRELKRQSHTDTRSLESMIKYLKKDMIDRYNLADHHLTIKQEIKDTEAFIEHVNSIIEVNF